MNLHPLHEIQEFLDGLADDQKFYRETVTEVRAILKEIAEILAEIKALMI